MRKRYYLNGKLQLCPIFESRKRGPGWGIGASNLCQIPWFLLASTNIYLLYISHKKIVGKSILHQIPQCILGFKHQYIAHYYPTRGEVVLIY
jgi:hypothetical protein